MKLTHLQRLLGHLETSLKDFGRSRRAVRLGRYSAEMARESVESPYPALRRSSVTAVASAMTKAVTTTVTEVGQPRADVRSKKRTANRSQRSASRTSNCQASLIELSHPKSAYAVWRP